MYMQRVVVYPQLGKVLEMQQHLESWVKTRQGQGAKVGLSMQMFGPEGAAFVTTVRFNDLAELEQSRQRNRTNQAFHDYLAKTDSLSRHPQKIELMEVLVPLPN
jgi:hypothetical protein